MDDPNGFFVDEDKATVFRSFPLADPINAIIALYGMPEGPQVGIYQPDIIYDQSVNGVVGRLSAIAAFPTFENPYITGTKSLSRDTVIFKNPLYDTIVPEPLYCIFPMSGEHAAGLGILPASVSDNTIVYLDNLSNAGPGVQTYGAFSNIESPIPVTPENRIVELELMTERAEFTSVDLVLVSDSLTTQIVASWGSAGDIVITVLGVSGSTRSFTPSTVPSTIALGLNGITGSVELYIDGDPQYLSSLVPMYATIFEGVTGTIFAQTFSLFAGAANVNNTSRINTAKSEIKAQYPAGLYDWCATALPAPLFCNAHLTKQVAALLGTTGTLDVSADQIISKTFTASVTATSYAASQHFEYPTDSITSPLLWESGTRLMGAKVIKNDLVNINPDDLVNIAYQILTLNSGILGFTYYVGDSVFNSGEWYIQRGVLGTDIPTGITSQLPELVLGIDPSVGLVTWYINGVEIYSGIIADRTGDGFIGHLCYAGSTGASAEGVEFQIKILSDSSQYQFAYPAGSLDWCGYLIPQPPPPPQCSVTLTHDVLQFDPSYLPATINGQTFSVSDPLNAQIYAASSSISELRQLPPNGIMWIGIEEVTSFLNGYPSFQFVDVATITVLTLTKSFTGQWTIGLTVNGVTDHMAYLPIESGSTQVIGLAFDGAVYALDAEGSIISASEMIPVSGFSSLPATPFSDATGVALIGLISANDVTGSVSGRFFTGSNNFPEGWNWCNEYVYPPAPYCSAILTGEPAPSLGLLPAQTSGRTIFVENVSPVAGQETLYYAFTDPSGDLQPVIPGERIVEMHVADHVTGTSVSLVVSTQDNSLVVIGSIGAAGDVFVQIQQNAVPVAGSVQQVASAGTYPSTIAWGIDGNSGTPELYIDGNPIGVSANYPVYENIFNGQLALGIIVSLGVHAYASDPTSLSVQVSVAKETMVAVYPPGRLDWCGNSWPAFKDDLEYAISLYSGLSESMYTTATWSTFSSSMLNGQLILDDPEATQQQVDDATQSIYDSAAALIVSPQGFFTAKQGTASAPDSHPTSVLPVMSFNMTYPGEQQWQVYDIPAQVTISNSIWMEPVNGGYTPSNDGFDLQIEHQTAYSPDNFVMEVTYANSGAVEYIGVEGLAGKYVFSATGENWEAMGDVTQIILKVRWAGVSMPTTEINFIERNVV